MNKYVSPIAIDLGAKNTGVVFTHYKEGEEPLSHKGTTFVLDVNNFTVSQKDRLVNRHRMRGEQRRKLAKRLFFLILEKEYGLKQEQSKIWEFIRGLLNRRGFTYLQEESEGDEIITVPLEFAKYFFPEEFKDCKKDVLDFIREQADEDESKALVFWKHLRDKDCKEKIKQFVEEYTDYSRRDSESYLKQIKETANGLITEIEKGNKPRKKYLEEIWTDIQDNAEIERLLTKSTKPISLTQFYHLIGHISNIQLRGIRKYFNDINMSKGNDYWDEKRLTKYYVRWVKSWHVPKDKPSKQYQSDIIRQVEKENKSALQIFFNNDPKISIPPFEDQNNRRIPTCQSLLLSAIELDKRYEGWRSIVKALTEKQDFYKIENINSILEEQKKSLQGFFHKNQTDKSNSKQRIPFDFDSILFQRILETTKGLDLYKIRLLVQVKQITEENGKSSIEGRDKLKKTLANAEENLKVLLKPEQKKLLLIIAEKFYQEITDARAGIWDENNSILAKCNSKTKHRNKMQKEVVEQILRFKFNSEISFEFFKENIWHHTLKGKSTVKSLCENIEKERKEFGNYFNEAFQKYSRRVYAIAKAESKEIALVNKTLSKDKSNNKTFSTIYENVELLANFIGTSLKQSDLDIKSYKNPFSLAQLANILEGDQAGFYKICSACQKENSWRSELEDLQKSKEEITRVAKATQLSADTGRPFDGQIDRIVTRIAKEVTTKKLEQIKANIKDGDKIEIPVLMENNQFSFTEEVLDLKKASKKAKDKSKKNLDKSASRLLSKQGRIKSDSDGICPYTGSALGDDGEIDHIIPRSVTKGTMLNSELNLIYCSHKGNQNKGNKEYSLSNIHEKFLKHHFKTAILDKVIEEINKTIFEVAQKNREAQRNYIIADSLESSQRIRLKLALLDSTLRNKVIPYLQTHSKALVNGTQAWFYKRLKKELESRFRADYNKSEIKIIPHYFGGNDDDFILGELRSKLAHYNENYKKAEIQTEGSHIVDASMLLAHSLLLADKNKGFLKSPLLKEEMQNEGEWLESLLPEEIEVKYIERTAKYRKPNPNSNSLFKAGMYAERFLSLLVDNKGIRFGFTPEKASPYIDSKYNEEIFSKLKSFLLYKGEFITESYDYYSQLETNPKYSLFKLHRNKVKEYLQNCPSNDELGLLFESLRYITQNKKIFDEKMNVTIDEKTLSKKEKYEIKFGKKKITIFEITMPYIDEWIKLKDYLKGCKPEDLENKAKEFFQKNRIRNESKHGTVSRKLSLPIKSEPSGGFRIKRTDDFKESIYQVQAGETSNIGFELNNGEVNFSNSILAKNYLSGNVSSYKLEDKILSDNFVYFDEWRILPLTKELTEAGIISLEMAPGTKSRCYIKTIISLKELLNVLFDSKEKLSLKSKIYKLSLYAKKDKEGFVKLSKFLDEHISKQRDFISLNKLNEKFIEIEYVSDGFPSSLKNLYNKGTKVENP